jgi:DNA mismatch repair protein MutL
MSVHGYIERPGRQTSFRREQHIFVNGRPASAPVISYALRDAYPSRPGDARPTAIIFIDLPPDQVDVNVHPAKREVRFRRPADVRDAVFTAITSAFASSASGSAAQTALPQPQPETPAPVTTASPAPCVPEPSAVPFQIPIQPTLPPHETPPPCGGEVPAQEGGAAQSNDSSRMETAAGPWRWFEFLAQTSEGYFILETDAGLVTLHPQAALERIVYERLLDGETAASQSLLIPETVQLTPLESVKIEAFKDVLAMQGFQIESFGDGVWKIDAVPQALGASSARDALAAIAHDIAEAGAKRGGTRWREELVAKSAARVAAGGVPRYTPESARRLVEQLASCRMPYICPRGRPVMIFKSNRELSKNFGRD